MEITTQGWIVFKISPREGPVCYKIFSSWRQDDRWRLSSGAYDMSSLTEYGDHFKWLQLSGTVYILPKNGEGGCTFYTGRVFDDICEKIESQGATVERITLCNKDNM